MLITLIVIFAGAYMVYGKEINTAFDKVFGKDETTEEAASAKDDTDSDAITPPAETPVSVPVSTPAVITPVVTPVVTGPAITSADMPLFYSVGNALWMRDSAGTASRILTTGAEGLYRVQSYDASHIGYYRCDTVTGDFGCSVYSLDWKTGAETKLWTGAPSDYLQQLAFYDSDTWAVLIDNSVGMTINWKLVLHDGATVTTLFNETSSEAYGRGGYVEDSNVLAFSPDGTYILHIATSSPRSGNDFRVYVYSMTGTEITQIPDGTQPVWISNTQILYRDKLADKAAVWTVTTGEKAVIASIPASAYRYQLHPDGKRVAFFTDAGLGEAWIYTIADKTAILAGTTLLDGTWAFNGSLVGNRAEACPIGGCDMPYYGDINVTEQIISLKTTDGTTAVIDLGTGGRAITVEYSIWK